MYLWQITEPHHAPATPALTRADSTVHKWEWVKAEAGAVNSIQKS
jgi:hypothetical protein